MEVPNFLLDWVFVGRGRRGGGRGSATGVVVRTGTRVPVLVLVLPRGYCNVEYSSRHVVYVLEYRYWYWYCHVGIAILNSSIHVVYVLARVPVLEYGGGIVVAVGEGWYCRKGTNTTGRQ